MKHIHFIVNPIAGSGNNQLSVEMLQRYFDVSAYQLALKYSNYKRHAKQLTMDSIAEGAQIMVACGGDGTINEIASCLVGTSIVLGIIPYGSGNGLASHLKIPKNIDDAIQLIKSEKVTKVDVGRINKNYFFSNTGSGFDANVIKHYERSKKRKFISYIQATIQAFIELHSSKKSIQISVNDDVIYDNPFMIFISNSNELGYKFSLTPKASLQDGFLDVMIVPRMGKLKTFLFGILLLMKKQHLLKEIKSYQDKSIKIKQKKDRFYQTQIDGELHTIDADTISITVMEKSLNVIS